MKIMPMPFSKHGHNVLAEAGSIEPLNPLRPPFTGGIVRAICLVFAGVLGFYTAPAANIVWVSDSNDPAVGFFGALPGQTDSAWVTMLQNAGHNVIRYNQPNAQATLLTQEELDALNTNDLIIVSRCVNSGAFQTPQVTQWNSSITKPLMDLSAFHARLSRLGWFSANEAPDSTPTRLSALNPNDPVTDYLFGGVDMNGTNMALPYDEAMDRNSNPVLGIVVAGGILYANATYVRDDNVATPPTTATGNFIAGFPAGTAVRAGADILSGYRMFFSGGSRESVAAPNSIPLYTARENLSPDGENIFLRAVQVAINNGVAPAINTGPVGVTSGPASLTVPRGGGASFSITVTGAGPRTLQWQRSVGDGSFTNIPGADTVFLKSSYSLSTTDLADSGAQFQVVVANGENSVISSVATLTVTPDSLAPLPVSAASFDGSVITVCFNEFVNTTAGGVTDPSNYSINGGASIFVTSVTPAADGRSLHLALSESIGASGTVDFFYLEDLFGNVSNSGPTITATNFGLTGVDVGTVNPPGSNFACDTNSFQVSAGGLDITSTADTLRFVHKSVDGDFDARVRVTSFVGTNDHFETTAKAMLLARADNGAGSQAVNVWITPSHPGDNNVTASYRTTTGGATNTFGTTLTPNGLPNAWMRIQREGDQFTTYRSLNGVDWISLGTATIALPATLNVGVGAVSHRAGKVVTATFSDFRISQGAEPPIAPTLSGFSYTGGEFSARFLTQNGVTYTVEYKDDLNVVPWSTLTTVIGDGTVKPFTDFGPVSLTGVRFYRITMP
ncbi:MAG TPA: hypothetical protein VNT99_16555 [Methylomirabilota bacterium]|nr:hypothetical protein [Methylomirabilota bacterium]